ncbi:3-hydroxyacyl-CoA dehydrogenase [Nitratireductor aquimarinus]|uniref:3-hydroxyacyl-CoA dehydrogenase NAD-binding domain-containing protein n=1 Tax=Nitratireductor TaxID=245876 RepID=UPI0019D3F267|nr:MULTISPECIES: 3-hydroxyacyl-CoA dehydrogenase NAD-binding domain-containing protein [Nitratireductor]MBN7776253.1 3-hydroxyacyl-CoA dehydrogenase [Nitratireductor pacificus]MBN7779120.1 3-hydroxyacyl-CoA dehydrogenase [Nitratireductor pacificus]MBN7787927.1 3-hydroxyacyl-CoA dehydrogenase [Nitratireductor aquimarinus]MBY6097974.1 3-hydroxyacyl-CoA dehydrogenase [Nitratireductor aquimarinus]MCA1259838.1 3-hydroxyacyl-CoA dehydrogenase [Nitratireductor aquimarinus]
MRIGIIGCGIIGSSWASAALAAGHDVLAFEASRKETTLETRLEEAFARSGLDPSGRGRLVVAENLSAFASGCDYIQESIIEDLEIKKALHAELDAIVDGGTIIATSSSAMPASTLMSELKQRSRCIVSHPAAPPHALPAVEVVPAPFTDQAVTERTIEILTALGQKPVLLNREVPGFVMNRLQGAMLLTMLQMVRDDVVSPEAADTLIRDAFGMRWALLGPLEGVHLNAPGGIADYFTSYRSMFMEMIEAPAPDESVLAPEVLEKLQAACAGPVPVDQIAARREWRDAALMGLRKWRGQAG